MTTELRTPLHDQHLNLGARMVNFGGWQMPLHYRSGILQEHLATRGRAGLFDVSHMGRLIISGKEGLALLQHVLTNNAAALDVGESHYTLISDEEGTALDDAYLYRFHAHKYLLVVNAANRAKIWRHLQTRSTRFGAVTLEDHSAQIAMLSLQGPRSKAMLSELIDASALPLPQRNALSIASYGGWEVWLARTGYSGEPLCFELFIPAKGVGRLWERLQACGAQPVGLGARDTLRLEAGLPLYGHELGTDPAARPIPIFATAMATFAVSFSDLKADFVGRKALRSQYQALQAILEERQADISALPRRIRPLELRGKGIARPGCQVLYDDRKAGLITSGTMVPLWRFEGRGLEATMIDQSAKRAIALALIDSRIPDGAQVDVVLRSGRVKAGVMPYLLRAEAPPTARPITWDDLNPVPAAVDTERSSTEQVRHWVQRSIDNALWRQRQCVNLIPSEQTASPLVRMLSVQDPAGRYAEHKAVKAFADAEIFYYQGTQFIGAVEAALAEQMIQYLSCRQVETRPVSGQMANMVLYSALVDFYNRGDRKIEQRRIRRVMNHHIIQGGHLSAQPMGALRDFVMRDPRTEKPAVVNFPSLPHNPYQVDLDACARLVEQYRPQLIILGRSMTLHKEPLREMRRLINGLELKTILLYDMAHVLGLVGPHFQRPFEEGADFVTGSTHKTFFGTQRGVVAADFKAGRPRDEELWEAVARRAFPGAVSNHHLGTLLGLLAAAMEMNAFKDQYQPRVIANAKAFAAALDQAGLKIAGDPAMGYTETHQVIVEVGYAQGAKIAQRLEANNIICNFQATPREEGFTASGALRLGVAEMTRFGMRRNDFENLAQLMADVILRQRNVKAEVTALRRRFLKLRYCFAGQDMDDLLEKLHQLVW